MANLSRRGGKSVETITHVDDRRLNIPTAEYESLVDSTAKTAIRVAFDRRNADLDPQLVWRGKDAGGWDEFTTYAPPLYIQEKVHPKALVDALIRQSDSSSSDEHQQIDLFATFDHLPSGADRTEFYEHEQDWTNRMILGDSLNVMASLVEREGLRGKVQCVYLDPPYGISFNSNFQWSTTSRDVKDGNLAQITREPEQVKAFRDTWRDGTNSYLTYLRDRLTVARDLLADSGSVFVQIGDENAHRLRSLLDEVFGDRNFIATIAFKKKKMPLGETFIFTMCDYILWYAKDRTKTKFRRLYQARDDSDAGDFNYVDVASGRARKFQSMDMRSSGRTESCVFEYELAGRKFNPSGGKSWKTNLEGMNRLLRAGRLFHPGESLRYKFFFDDYPVQELSHMWMDLQGATDKRYIVQTAEKAVQRCILMTTDPGDLVLDPTCGSGTTAYVAEQWGRRWITVDTSRVALALTRARLMGARYPYYLLADSREGQLKESEVSRVPVGSHPVHRNIRLGFVYERVPHVTIRAIASNAEIDAIWETWEATLEPLRRALNDALGEEWEEWEIPREADEAWSDEAIGAFEEWSRGMIARQQEIDASIAARTEPEYLYDRPYEDKKTVRVAGPFTVESVSPHRALAVDENDDLIDPLAIDGGEAAPERTFTQTILENLKTAGVQQAHKEDKIDFVSLTAWPGELICGEGRYLEGDVEKRAAIFIGPEFGTVLRADLVQATREAGDAGFDVLIACAFNYEAHTTEFNKLGSVPVLKARMNADLHMADDLKNTGKGNLFVIFGEPDIDLITEDDGRFRVKLNGVDVFHPQTGEVKSDSADGIACWFIDTEYKEESFFVRHAYFLGADDPYKALKTTLKAEIDEDAWATLRSDVSRPFDKPETGRIAVKVINHLGDEVMKVFRVA